MIVGVEDIDTCSGIGIYLGIGNDGVCCSQIHSISYVSKYLESREYNVGCVADVEWILIGEDFALMYIYIVVVVCGISYLYPCLAILYFYIVDRCIFSRL